MAVVSRTWPPVHRAALTLALLSLTVALMAGCGGAGNTGSTGRPGYEIRLGSVDGLGRVLVDGGGYTLYMYTPDHRGRSTCYQVCARQWPPLLLPPGVRHAVAGPGVDAALLGTVSRTNGSVQVTYNKWPLYRYDADVDPGQATGQGDDMGLWYVLSPNGSIDRRTVPGQTS
jgi:predicted lipoprotein with Yx(FWY)xxD motif